MSEAADLCSTCGAYWGCEHRAALPVRRLEGAGLSLDVHPSRVGRVSVNGEIITIEAVYDFSARYHGSRW